RHTLLASDIAHLRLDVEAAAREHRDLLTELATHLRNQIADAQRRFELIDRQISAHGKGAAMDDKLKAGLPHSPTSSTLSLHSTRSSIIARGRRDAANAAS